ncbi:MAG: prohibitin family protein [Bacteroidales bacterium]|nr:prohibitin family protein [Bacteroidales bacterium]
MTSSWNFGGSGSTANHNTTVVTDSRTKRLVVLILVGIAVLIVLFSSFYTISSTERGVLSTLGKISEVPIEDGLHVKIPFIQTVKKVNVQRKKVDGVENTYTGDLQTADIEYTITYDLVREHVPALFKNVGRDYHEKMIVPAVQAAMKGVFGTSTATEIIENRMKISSVIEDRLRQTVPSEYFANIQFTLAGIDYDDDFEKAIKEKQVAEQNALKAKNVTIQVEEQAKQTKIAAEAEAEAMRIKANALERNPKLVNYEAVQKWDGKLPEYMLGESVPFINLNGKQ